MIVFNLSCDQSHAFEGWFGSTADMASQQDRGLLACPVCGSSQIEKQLSAPRLNLLPSHAPGGRDGDSSAAMSESTSVVPQSQSQSQSQARQPHALLAPEHAQWREMIRHVIENTENVGQSFPEEARRIHYKEAPARSIRGVATRQEAAALAEEGIEVAQLPFPVIGKNELN